MPVRANRSRDAPQRDAAGAEVPGDGPPDQPSYTPLGAEKSPPGEPPTDGDRPAAGESLDQLRTQPTTLTGSRQEAATALRHLLRGHVRFVTLTWPPDVAKTKLALALVTSLVEACTLGVVFVDLTPSGDPVHPDLASKEAFEVEATEGEALLSRLKRYIRGRHLLLVLGDTAQMLVPTIQSRLDRKARVAGWARGEQATHGLLAPLTHREEEVSILVAGGSSNREIATALTITEGTAESHVQHILNKLGFHSRVQIAAWIVERKINGAS